MKIKMSSGEGFIMNMGIDYGRNIETKFVVKVWRNNGESDFTEITKKFDKYEDAEDYYNAMYEHLYNP